MPTVLLPSVLMERSAPTGRSAPSMASALGFYPVVLPLAAGGFYPPTGRRRRALLGLVLPFLASRVIAKLFFVNQLVPNNDWFYPKTINYSLIP